MISFLQNKKTTLLVVTATEVMRADLVKGKGQPSVKQLVRAERQRDTPLTNAAEMAVTLIDAKPSPNTVLVAQDFWTGILDIDDRSIYGCLLYTSPSPRDS